MAFAFARRNRFWVAALPFLGLVASTFVGSGGLLDLRELRRERSALSEEVLAALRENETLRRRILALRGSGRDLERLAREKLGLVRDGEIVYRFRSRNDEAPGQRRLADRP